MAYSKFIALMFGTQQIGDYLYGRKSRDGDFDEDRIPKTGQFLREQLAAPVRLAGDKTRSGIDELPQIETTAFRGAEAANQIHRIEMSRRAHQLPLFGSDLVRFGDLERLQPVGPSHPEGAAARRTMPHTRIGRSSTCLKRAVP